MTYIIFKNNIKIKINAIQYIYILSVLSVEVRGQLLSLFSLFTMWVPGMNSCFIRLGSNRVYLLSLPMLSCLAFTPL